MNINYFTPLIIKDLYKKYFSKYGWFGDYKTWEEAKKDSSGYDSDEIITKVKNSLLKVKNGDAKYERDSVLFDKIQYSPIILAGLLLSKKNNSLFILDFGGSLGSTYFQNKKFLDKIKDVKYSIVEQKNFVETGKKYFQDNQLKFYENIDECLKKENPNTIILSSVLQYLEEPYKFLKSILNKKFEIIVIDRTPFIQNKDRITIQKVNPKIYNASYPCWFFNEEKFKKLFIGYELIEEFDTVDKANIKSKFKGLLYVKK